MATVGEAWRNEPDFTNRDPNGINTGLQVAYEDVFAEPDHTHSSDCAWRCAFRCFNVWKMLCYSIFTTCCSWAIGCFWGCYFAYVAISYIWCINPCFAVLEIYLSCVKRYYLALTDAIYAPCFIAMSHIFDAFRKN